MEDFSLAKENVLHTGTSEPQMTTDVYDAALAIEQEYESLTLKVFLYSPFSPKV